MNKAIAVLISDIHYNLQTLSLADAAMRQAVLNANSLEVPLIVAGDLHDSKANIRAECINAMQETFAMAEIHPIVLRGNHDAINEKSEEHALNFLAGLAKIVVQPMNEGLYYIPYQHDTNKLKTYLKTLPKDSLVIMHQGLSGSASGEYMQDKTAISPKDVAGLRVISGHYHTRQTIKLPKNGKWDYIGNPYTLNYAEANDPEKGFQILYDDASLKFVPTNLRKHIVQEYKASELAREATKPTRPNKTNRDDLIWIKVSGTKEELAQLNKEYIQNKLVLSSSFKLDLIPDSIEAAANRPKLQTQQEILDSTISKLDVTDKRKQTLKDLWKSL